MRGPGRIVPWKVLQDVENSECLSIFSNNHPRSCQCPEKSGRDIESFERSIGHPDLADLEENHKESDRDQGSPNPTPTPDRLIPGSLIRSLLIDSPIRQHEQNEK